MHISLELLLLLPILIYSALESFVKFFIPKKRKAVSGEIVLITGAGQGIGRLTAYEFAKLKSKLVLWDINKHGIEETAAECRKLGARAHAYVVDCSNREDIYNYSKKVKAEVGDVSILVNNAGVVYTSDLFATQDPQIEKTFEVNVLAHFWTSKAFLPAMMKNNHGHIVTVASSAGHTVTPFLLAYCSSKFAAVGFHRALTMEIAALGKHGIKTSCLCPYFINTGFIKNPTSRVLSTLEPEEVVNKLMKGILTEQKMIFVPSYLSAVTLLERAGQPPFAEHRSQLSVSEDVLKVQVLDLVQYGELIECDRIFERIFPERFQNAMRRILNVKFDVVTGLKNKAQ